MKQTAVKQAEAKQAVLVREDGAARVSRRYLSSTTVAVVESADGGPLRFCWRGRRYEVRALLAHWVEAVPWWVDRASGQAPAQRQVWRVEAISSTGISGVYDLARACDGWSLERVID